MQLVPKGIKPLNLQNTTKALGDMKFRDKVMRFVQYLGKFAAHSLLETDPKNDLGNRIKLLSSGIGLHRKAFKVGDFLTQYHKFLDVLENAKDDTKKTLNLLLNAVMGVFSVFDNLVWLTTLKVLKLDKDSLKMKAYRFRLLACVLQSIIGVMDIQAAEKKAQKEPIGSDARVKAEEAYGAKSVGMVKNVLDFVTYSNSSELFLNAFGVKLQDNVIGIVGAMSSASALYSIWISK